MDRYGERFNKTAVERRNAVGKASDRRSGDHDLIGHAAIMAHTENHAGSEDAAVISPVDAGRTGTTRRKWFKGDRRPVGECSGNLVTERGLEAHREEMEIGTADPGRGNLDENSVASRYGYLNDLRYSFGTSDGTHGHSPCEIQKTGRCQDTYAGSNSWPE
jgi:hypothetical protein